MEAQTNKARIEARKAMTQAKQCYDDLVQRHNAKKRSVNQKFEAVFRANGVKREHYHGGKFNGVACFVSLRDD